MNANAERIGPQGLKVTMLKPFGAEVTGDLSQNLSPEAQAFLADVFYAYGLILARKQTLSLYQQRKLLECFGPVLGDRKELDYVTPDDGVLGTDSLAFHSDFAFAHTPYKGLALHALDVVEGETSTRFAHAGVAYDQLTETQRQRLSRLTTTAVSTSTITRRVGYDVPASAHKHDREAIVIHHRTGKPILYVNEGQTARFNELDRGQSDSFLEELFGILYKPAAVLEHPWSVGDIVIWDNIAVQHGRPAFPKVTRRRLQRASVADVDGGAMIPKFVAGDPK